VALGRRVNCSISMQFLGGCGQMETGRSSWATFLKSHQDETYCIPSTLDSQLHYLRLFAGICCSLEELPMNFSFSRGQNKLTTRCSICGNFVALEASNTDEQGRSVHEECYVGRTVALFAAQQSARRAQESASSLFPLEPIRAIPFCR
jgi:hypothetical protein